MPRASVTALALFALLATAGCGRDFDSLFFDAGVIPSTRDGAVDAAGTSDANGAADAGSDSATPCTGSCVNQSGCDAGSGTCITVCSGCCDCGMQTCPANDANKRCDAQCTAGAMCNVECLVNGPCTMTCGVGSQCSFRCGPNADSCELSCADDSKKDCGGGRFVCGRQCP